MRLLRNLSRRKLRTSLTIAGITIGIWALVVFSSMANKINSVVDGGADYFAGKVTVTDATGDAMVGAPMSAALADDIAAVDGVALAVPQISMTLDPEGMGMSMGNAETILAGEPIDPAYSSFELRYASGRALTTGDEGRRVVVLGSDLSRRYGAETGETFPIRGRDFTVVGVYEPTLTPADTTALLPLVAGQELFADDVPAIVRDRLGTADLASQIVVFPAKDVGLEELAARIEATVPDVHAMTAEIFEQSIQSSVAMFNAIIVGVALISLVVGGLSVINTMAMSVQERTREIGIKRAIGGSRFRVVRELVSEAGVIGLIGGLLGLGLGSVVVYLANEAGRSSATVLFELTTDTALFALAFSTILGMVAGIVPAWSAARLDPVRALRHE